MRFEGNNISANTGSSKQAQICVAKTLENVLATIGLRVFLQDLSRGAGNRPELAPKALLVYLRPFSNKIVSIYQKCEFGF